MRMVWLVTYVSKYDQSHLSHDVQQFLVTGRRLPYIIPVAGHGTFVSGIIASTANNALLTAGIVQSLTLIPCKFIGASGTGQLSDALLCFGYCLLQKAHVISNSYGSISNSPAFETVVTKAVQQGALVVCSAGNSGLNTDRIPQYPSALSKTNMGILSVAAFGEDKGLWVNSNYGKDTVQVAAPGEQILGLGLAGATKNDTGLFVYAGSVLLFWSRGMSRRVLYVRAWRPLSSLEWRPCYWGTWLHRAPT